MDRRRRLRRMAGTYSALGVAGAAFTFCAVGARLIQLEMDSTTAEAEERVDVVLLLMLGSLFGLAQVLMALVAVAAMRRVSTVLAHLSSLSNAWILAAILAGAVGRGHLDGIYRCVLFTGYGTLTLPFRLFFSAGLVIALFR